MHASAQVRAFCVPVRLFIGYSHRRRQWREALRQAEHLFASLLHRAFRGELLPRTRPVGSCFQATASRRHGAVAAVYDRRRRS